MGRASRLKEERRVADVAGFAIPRGKKYRYQGKVVGWELNDPTNALTMRVENPPPEPLHKWELQLPWTAIGDGK